MSNPSNRELLDELGIDTAPEEELEFTVEEERIISGFENIHKFVAKYKRLPCQAAESDIFERLLATRLEVIREQGDWHLLLKSLDNQGLLIASEDKTDLDNAALLAEVGVDVNDTSGITTLTHVKPRQPPVEIGEHIPCEDFEEFEALFTRVQNELQRGFRSTARHNSDDASINKGDLFILKGQKIYIAELGKMITNKHNHKDCRLRVIYDNGTESNILMRSLQRALAMDSSARRISELTEGPLFSGEAEEGDQSSGTIYICRSLSTHSYIAENRDLVHKIGVTSMPVNRRIADAENDPTFLMAKVEVVADYELVGIKRNKLENLLHCFFEAARLDIEIKDRFGKPIKPREWFCVPLSCIDEAVELVRQGTLAEYFYDTGTASIKEK